ncbi:hypothetical protein Ciccas_014005, partial [Cichlidogyrus casuarinus]
PVSRPACSRVALSSVSCVSKSFSPIHSLQGESLTLTLGVSHELVTLETVTRSRASPEAGFQPVADSGSLEAKKPTEDCTVLSMPGQSQCPAQLQLPSCLPQHHMPAGFVPVSAGGSGELGQHFLISAGGSEGPAHSQIMTAQSFKPHVYH